MTITGSGTWGELLGRRHIAVAVVLAGGVALYAVNTYLVASMLPTVIGEIGGERYYAWATTAFLVASVASSVTVGKAITAMGPRGAYLSAIAFFIAGSLLCAVAPTTAVLLAGRLVQGVGGGLLAGLGYALIRLTLPPGLWSRATALISAMWGVGTFVGPAVGGVFGEFGLWRMAFVALAVLSAVIAVIVPSVLAKTERVADSAPVPVGSMVLTGLAALAVSVAGVVTDIAVSVGLLVVGAVAVVWFVLRERAGAARVLPRSTFAPGVTRWLYVLVAALAVGSTVEAFVPLFGQRVIGLGPIAAGFLGAAIAAGWTVGEIPAASAGPVGARRLIVVSPVLLAAGLAALAVTQAPWAGWLWVAALLVAGAGIGIAWPHLATFILRAEPDPAEANRAAAAINTVQLTANAFGTAVAGLLVNLGAPSGALMYGVLAVLVLAAVPAGVAVSRSPVKIAA